MLEMLMLTLLSFVTPPSATVLLARSEDDVAKPEEVKIGGDEHKRYLLHGAGKDAPLPEHGWKLLVVMPGGDGNADFAPFVGRIRANALGKDWISRR